MRSKMLMKPVFFLTVVATSVLFIAAGCGSKTEERPEHSGEPSEQEQRDAEHRSLRKDVAHRGIVLLDETYETTPAVRSRMESVLDAYGTLRNALAKDDLDVADQAAATMRKAVLDIPAKEMDGEGREAWKQHVSGYARVLREFQHVDSLQKKRSYFAHITEIVYCTVKSFGLEDNLYNVFFCPMAFDGKGAYWLSEKATVKNPYYGEKMLKCGELVEVLNN